MAAGRLMFVSCVCACSSRLDSRAMLASRGSCRHGRHGAKALASRGTMLASSGQCRRITLVMPFCATQSMPKGE